MQGFKALGRLKAGTMNKTELAYSRELEILKRCGNILWYSFESMTFRLANRTTYTPDFMVMLANGELEAHEVKGHPAIFRDDAKVKVKVFSETFPIGMVVVYPDKVIGWRKENY